MECNSNRSDFPTPTTDPPNGVGPERPLPSDVASHAPSTTAADDGQPAAAEGAPAPARMTSEQKITFASAILATLANTMAFSIIAVFYPIEAKQRGMTQTSIGLVFTIYALASAISSPLWGKVIPVTGARFVFLSGAFVCGGCNILLGFINAMPNLATFTGFSLALRAMEGLGMSACFTASSAIVAYAFPNNVGTAVSLIEMTAGLSYAIGPAIGGFIYDAGGYRLPFFILGGFVLLIDVVNFFILPVQGSKDQESGPLGKLLRIPAVWIACLNSFMGGTALSTIDPTLSLHLKTLNFTVVETSLLFVALGVTYAVFSVLWGAVADSKKTTRIMIIIGSYGTGLFFLLLGPSPLLKLPPTQWLAIACIPFGGLAISLIAMPTFVDIMTTAEWYGLPGGLGLTSVVSGIWFCGFSLGSVIGPMLGSALIDDFGYAYACTILGGLCIFVMVVVSLFSAWEYRWGKGRRSPPSLLSERIDPSDDERKGLLSVHS